jgi:hypothetical protein
MRRRLIQMVILCYCVVGISCSENIADCPSKMCVLAGGWKLTAVYADDVLETSDLTQYRLILTMPDPADAVKAPFDRTQPSGATDSGTWSLENNGTILQLVPSNNTALAENWIITYFSPRKLVLLVNRDVDIKKGPAKIEFTLEPF